MAKKSQSQSPHHTVLFKKILSSFFAKESMMQIGMNPASMFVSFVSAKQFFWLINRRMAEHYKLNLFDVHMESFDAKVGIGHDPSITIKNLDIYYAYNSSANFVWYKAYTPNLIATGLTMLYAGQTVSLFEDYDNVYFKHFIYTIYFLVFVVISKIKTFPDATHEEQYDWFVQTFRSLYELMFDQTDEALSPDKLNEIKMIFVDDIKTMFSLFYVCKDLGQYFTVVDNNYSDFLARLFAGDLHHKTHDKYIKQYLELHEDLRQTTTFWSIEKHILELILPSDILINYLFSNKEAKFIAEHIVTQIYSTEKVWHYLEQFLVHGDHVKSFIEYSISFSLLKKNFFVGLHQYIKAKIHMFEDKDEYIEELSTEEDIDELLSYLDEYEDDDDDDTIWTETTPSGKMHIQTITLDKLINFYISLVGGMWTAQWDSGYMRFHKPQLLQQLIKQYPMFGTTHQSLAFYARFFALYEKNTFYYQYVLNHVRSGKDSFVLPQKAMTISHNSNRFIIQLLHESVWAILLQDINPSDITLYIKKIEIIDLFKTYYGASITTAIKSQQHDLLVYIYHDYSVIIDGNIFFDLLDAHITSHDIKKLKDRMYSLDFWMNREYSERLMTYDIAKNYDNPLLLHIFSTLKETFFGLLLYVKYVISQEHAHQKNYHSRQLIELYCSVVLAGNHEMKDMFVEEIYHMLDRHVDVLDIWILLDDNQDYMYVGFNNRVSLPHDTTDIHEHHISQEDTIRLLWYLKHITYYNRRMLMPHGEIIGD